MPSLRGSLSTIFPSSSIYLYIGSSSLQDGYMTTKPYQPPGEDDKKLIYVTKRVDKGSLGGHMGKKAEPNVFVNKIKNSSKTLMRS